MKYWIFTIANIYQLFTVCCGMQESQCDASCHFHNQWKLLSSYSGCLYSHSKCYPSFPSVQHGKTYVILRKHGVLSVILLWIMGHGERTLCISKSFSIQMLNCSFFAEIQKRQAKKGQSRLFNYVLYSKVA